MSIALRKKLVANRKIRSIVMYSYKAIKPILMSVSPVFGCRFTYFISTGRRLNLKNPQTFDEKIQWLKLYAYRNNPLISQCADKYAVREYVAEKGFGRLVNELYAVYDRVEDIDWDGLPDSFVIKTTHGSGGNIICDSKAALDVTAAIKKLSESMNTDYSKLAGELYYRNIPRKIIVEKYLMDDHRRLARDYKIYCFNGKARLCLAISERDTDIKLDFMALEWERLRIGQEEFESTTIPEKPWKLKEICGYAEALAEPFPFVRVDFYNIDNQPIFGEMTFTPAAGVSTYYNEYGQKYLGQLLELNK